MACLQEKPGRLTVLARVAHRLGHPTGTPTDPATWPATSWLSFSSKRRTHSAPVYLLALSLKEKTFPMESGEQTQRKRQHIFAVNGAVDFLDVIRELLQEEEYNVTTTNFVPETYEQIAALQPNLLIIDLAVGMKAGWELLERLTDEADTRGIPVIVVSTSPQILNEIKSDPERFGGQRFLRKPVNLDQVLETVDELIGKA